MAESSTTNVNSLIINKVSRRTYKDMYDSGTLNNSQLYVIKDATLDAVGSRVLNVADPELITDAANMKYVTSVANDIRQNLIGNVIYRGHITLGIAGGVPAVEVVAGKQKLVAGATLADIVCAYLKNAKGLSEDAANNYELDNGSAFQFTFAAGIDDDTYTTADGIVITNKDCIIINNHETGGKVVAAQIKRDNIDLIDIQYDTLVQRAEFETTITGLNNSISAVNNRTNTNAQNINTNTNAINSVAATVSDVETTLGSRINNNSTRLQTVEATLREQETNIVTNISRIDSLSSRNKMVGTSSIDNTVFVDPFTYSRLDGFGTSFKVKVNSYVSGSGFNIARNCVLIVECGATVPDIIWESNFHPRTNSATDFKCVANTRNIYYISEYIDNEFMVEAWQETTGGNAVS